MSLIKAKILIFLLLTFFFFVNDVTSFQCSKPETSKTKINFQDSNTEYNLNKKFEIYFKAEVINSNAKNWGIEFDLYYNFGLIGTQNRKIKFTIDLKKQLIDFENNFLIQDKVHHENKIVKRKDKKYRFKFDFQKNNIKIYQIENKSEILLFSTNINIFLPLFLTNNAYIRFIGFDNKEIKINTDGDDEPLLCGGNLVNEMPSKFIHYDSTNGESGDINEEESIPSDSIKYLYLNFNSYHMCQNFKIEEIKIDGKSYKVNIVKEEFYIKIKLDIDSIGEHNIYLSTTKGIIKFKFYIISSGINKLVFYGHDGKEYKLIYNKFNWGKVEGDFKLNDFDNGYLKADFLAYDTKDNLINNLDVNKIKKDISLSVADENLEFEIVYLHDGIYEIQAKITKAEKYILESNYFYHKSGFKLFNHFEFLVYDNKPTSSSCSLVSLGPFNANDKVTFECELLLSNEKKSPEYWKHYFGLEFKCLVEELTTKEISIATVEYNNSNLICVYDAKKNGNYEYSAYYILNGEEIKMNFNEYTNKFTVNAPPNSINYTLIYGFNEKKWSKNPDYLIYNKDENILAIEFYNDEDFKVASDFKLSYIKYLSGYIYSKHIKNRTINLNFKIKEFDKKKNAVLVYVNKTDVNFFLKTSYGYNCVIKYNYISESIKEIELKMNLDKNGEYDVCDHDLSVQNTLFIKDSSIKKVYPNDIIKLGELLLQTKDNKLYNYDIPKTEINFKISPTIKEPFSIYANKDEKIDGKYDIYMKTSKSGSYSIDVYIKNNITNWTIVNEVLPLESISNFNINDFHYKIENGYIIINDCSVDETPIFYFKGEDEYNNILNYQPTQQNNNLNVIFELTINGNIQNDLGLEFKYNNNKYEIIDNLKIIGEYKLTIYSNQRKKKLIFKYNKIPGKVSALTSTMNIINNKQIIINEQSTIEVELKDKYGNNIALNKEKYKSEIKNVNFYIKSKDNIKYDYIFPTEDEKIKPILKIKTMEIKESGFYTLEGLIYGESVINCQQCAFTCVHDIFNIDNSKLYALQRDFIELYNSNSIFRFNKEYSYPVFKFELMNDQNELIEKIDSDIPLDLYVKKKELNEKSKLEKSQLSLNSFIYYSKEKLNGFYDLIIEYHNEIKKTYSLQFLNDNIDGSQNNYDKEKTYVSSKILRLKAGEKKYIKLELRTNNNLRYELFDINLLSFSHENNIDFKINKIKGNKLGQSIIEITCYNISSLESPHEIKILYNLIEITSIQLIVSPNKLSHFKIDTKSLKNDLKLVDGTTNSIPIITLHPYDEYENVNTDIFNSDIYNSEILLSLFNVISEYPVKLSVTANSVEKTINLKLSTNYAETIQLKSIYLKNIYTMDILAENVSTKSSGYIIGGNSVKSSDKFYFEILPRDSFGNKIDKYNRDFNFTLKYMKSNEFNEYDMNINPINEEIPLKYEYSFNKIGSYIIKGYLNGKEINNYNNIIYVKNNDVELEKTKIKFNENLYSSNNTIEISKSSLPFLYLQLYDKNDNIIEDVSEFTFKYLFDNSDNVICPFDYNNYKLLTICKNSIDLFLRNTNEEHNLIIQFNEKSILFKIKLNGLIDSNTSEDPIDYSKTLVSKNTLNLITGEKTQIKITLRTENKIRINGYFDNYEEIFDLKIEGIEQENLFTKEIIPGGEFGTYIILFSYKKLFKEEENIYLNIYVN